MPELKARDLVHKSKVGVALVGDWQKDHSYIPCRLFKNIAAGAIPSSNSDFQTITNGVGVFNSDLRSLVDQVLNISMAEAREMVSTSQAAITKFTYEQSIQRIFEMLGED